MDAEKGTNKVSPEIIAIGGGALLLFGVLAISKGGGANGPVKTTVVQPSSAALNAASANYAASLNNQLQSTELNYQHQENVLNIGVTREKNQQDSSNAMQKIQSDSSNAMQKIQSDTQLGNAAIQGQVTIGQQQATTNQQQIAAQQSHDTLGFFGTIIGGILGIFGI
jgi:hypothetical protein